MVMRIELHASRAAEKGYKKKEPEQILELLLVKGKL
jgi:hypothetical protein